ncbi:glycosyltransferase, partial [Candidatus Peregrinibacteria bacterium]|nr:glycosyltransferase [Candidatus Peregrinibacteria bacterium]
VLLESFLCGKPVLVNEKSKVLKGHCMRGNGGLWYSNKDEFVEAFRYLERNKDIADKLGKSGYEYVRNNYRWDISIDKFKNFLCKINDQKIKAD